MLSWASKIYPLLLDIPVHYRFLNIERFKMQFDDVLLGRRSIRGYKPDPVPKALIEEILAFNSNLIPFFSKIFLASIETSKSN